MVPIFIIGDRCDHPDLRRKAVLARDEPGPCYPKFFIRSALEVDCCLLGVARDFHGVICLALGERSEAHLELHFVLLDLLLASLGDLFSQVLIEIRFALPMRISIFLKKNEAQEAGFLC